MDFFFQKEAIFSDVFDSKAWEFEDDATNDTAEHLPGGQWHEILLNVPDISST